MDRPFLTHHQVWRRAKQFQIGAKTGRSRLGVTLSERENALADYIPLYDAPQLFWWQGYFLEVKCDRREDKVIYDDKPKGRIHLSVFTLDVSVVDKLVEEARELYTVVARSNVTVHAANSLADMYTPIWNDVKHKVRRPVSSVVLRSGTIETLLSDMREFLGAEDWYVNAGIPYRRGYLLHGPPGTGKSSTIYALAGELNLEIYTLSLGSKFVDDSYLHRAVSGIPRGCIFLIEDIDCSFVSREEEEEAVRLPRHSDDPYETGARRTKSGVTMSALLNVIDGVFSEDGVIFIATTNYYDRLDPALLRPGRVDLKVEYSLTSRAQAAALFRRFYPQPAFVAGDDEKKTATVSIDTLAQDFADGVPESQVSTAELQGFLLFHKTNPEAAVAGIQEWVESELTAGTRRTRKTTEGEVRCIVGC